MSDAPTTTPRKLAIDIIVRAQDIIERMVLPSRHPLAVQWYADSEKALKALGGGQ